MKELAVLMPNEAIKQFVLYYQQAMDQLDTEEINHHLSNLEQEVKSLLQAYSLEKDRLEKEKTNHF